MRALVALLMFAAPAQADCRLALALAVDVSRSVDAEDYVIQSEGLADALTDPAVEAAVFGAAGEVSILVYQWSGRDYQEVVAAWTEIATPEDLHALAGQVRRMERTSSSFPTALGAALRFGLDRFEDAPTCARQVLDVAGDGRNNDGLRPDRIYEKYDFGALVVNGLVIGEHETGLLGYYETEVIRGAGAFVEFAPKQADYPHAIRRKLIRELSDMVSDADPATLSPERQVFLTKAGAIQR